jgi:tripartite ATP-independent transporter DctM subunit
MMTNTDSQENPIESSETLLTPAPLIFLRKPLGWLISLGQRFALIAVVCILIIAFSTVTDVILRNFFGKSLYGLNEIATLLVAVGVSTCLPFGLANGAALTVDLLLSQMPDRFRSWMGVFSTVLIAIFFGLMSWRVWLAALKIVENGETTLMTDLPKGPFFMAMAIAFGVASLIQILKFTIQLIDVSKTAKRIELAIAGGFTLVLAHGLLGILGVVSTDLYYSLVPSSPLMLAMLAFIFLWVLILVGVPVAVGMGVIGILGTAAILDTNVSLEILGSETTAFITQDALSVLPLFLLMGAFATVAGIGKDLYALCYALIGHIRGGLAHASILACAGFGTLTGSSVATQMSIGKIALFEMRERNYSTEIAAGSIAAGGTLGQLIPPSSALILYAVLTQQSVGQLFVGAIIPGVLATLLYMATVAVWLWIYPDHAKSGTRSSRREIAKAAKGSWSVILLLGLVLGGIYSGFFTDLEAGAVGASGAFLIALARGRINKETFWQTMGQTTASLAMMYSLIFGVAMLSFFFGISGLPQAFVGFVEGLNLPPMGVVLALVLCYLVLGTAMDAFAMMVVTIPIFVPVVMSLGYDPIWWGLMTIVCMEAGMISPPFGLNIFVISSLDKTIPITTVYRGCWPFFCSTIVKIILLLAFPWLVTWLPSSM